MEDVSGFVNNYVIPHWPFFAGFVIFMITGQTIKKNIFTKTAHMERKPVWFWWWGRKTLALQPIFFGGLLGAFWQNPEPGVEGVAASVCYFAASGGLSVWGYETVKGLAKKRGIDLTLPGVDPSQAPPPPDKDNDAEDTPAPK